MKKTTYLKRLVIQFSIVLIAMIAILAISPNVMAASPTTNMSLTKSDINIIQSLTPSHPAFTQNTLINLQSVGNGVEHTVDYGNSSKVAAMLKRSDLSPQVRKLILSIPTQAQWGIKTQTSSIPSQNAAAATCTGSLNTATGYIQDTDIYGIVLWSYRVNQPFEINTSGTDVCGYGARDPYVYSNSYLTWGSSSDTFSTTTLPCSECTEINKAVFAPGFGHLGGETGRINLFMYGGGYWDVSVGIE